MKTPAQRHRERKILAVASAASALEPAPAPRAAAAATKASLASKRRAAADAKVAVAAAVNDNTAAEPAREPSPAARQRLAMADASRRIKALKSTEAKARLKRDLLPEFEPWVAGVVTAAEEARETDPAFRAPQDDVAIKVLIWSLDVGQIDQAVHLFLFARRHGWSLPANFKRDLSTFVTEQAAEFAIAELEAARPAPLVPLLILEEHVAQDDMPDEVRARLHKAIGRELARRADAPAAEGEAVASGARRARLEKALEQLRRAAELDKACGVKGDIARLERDLRKDAPPAVQSREPPAGS